MKHRWKLAVLAAALLLLCACGGNAGENGTGEPAPAVPTAGEAAETESPAVTPEVQQPAETEAPKATPEPTPEPAPEPTPEPAPAPTPEPAYDYAQINTDSSALLRGTADMGQDYIDSITFLGDSTTYGMKYYAVLSDGKETKQVWTPTSGTLTLSYQGFAAIWYPEEDSEITIREAVEKKLPERMIITLGVNGVSFMDKDYFISEYTDLVTDIMELSPDTKVILQSIFPVASNYEYLSSINNEIISEANTWVLSVAEATGARYLNTSTVLMGEDGWLISGYQNGDGMHLNAEGFSAVLDYIRTHGYE